MKRFLTCLMVAMMLCGCILCAQAAEDGLKFSVYTSRNGDWKMADEVKQDGCITAYTDACGHAMIELFNTERNCVYRMKISGVAENGKPFELNEVITGNENFYFRVAQTSGTYGPYDLQIWGNDEMIHEKISFVAEVTAPQDYASMFEEGYIGSSSFKQLESLEDVSITNPASGSIVTGRTGYELKVHTFFSLLNDKVNISVQEVKTGNVIAEYEDTTFSPEKNDSFSGMWAFSVPIENEFNSGEEYDIILTVGEKTVTRRVVMQDESKVDTEKASEPIQFYMVDEDYERTGIEDFKQDDQYVVNLGKGGIARFCIQGGIGKYRVKFSGTGPEGNAFELHENWGDNVSFFGFTISSRAGTYGPIKIGITSGDLYEEYDVTFTVSEDIGENAYGLDTYGMVYDTEIDAPAFIEIVNEELQEPIVIESPANGSQMSGRPGFNFPVTVEINKVNGTLKVELINCETGEVVDSMESNSENTGRHMFHFEMQEKFKTGSEYEVRVKQGKQTYTSRFTMVLEPNPDAQHIDIATVTLIPNPNAEYAVGDPYEGYMGLPEDYALIEDTKVISLIGKAAEGMSVAACDADFNYRVLRYQDREVDGLMNSFSAYYPVSSLDEMYYYVVGQPGVLVDTAFYNEYVLQSYQAGGMPADRPINMQALKAYLGEAWKPLNVFDFAKSFIRDANGTAYCIIPAYYSDENGILYDQVYLYVLMIKEKPDTAYLESKEEYLEDDYSLCRTEHMMIADRQIVADILSCVLDESDFEAPEDTIEYRTLAKGSKGDDVKKLQAKLIELGYLTGSADGIFGNMSKEAVMAYQQAMGLEATGEADAEMQKVLYFNHADRELLKAWIEAR